MHLEMQISKGSAFLKKLFSKGTSDHGLRRIQRAGLSGISGIVATGLQIVISFVSVPLTVNYLGPERYGVWIILSSLLSWLAISDLGFGAALVNTLAEADGLEDRHYAQGLVATAFWLLIGIATIIGLLTLLLVPMVNWMKVFNVSAAVDSVELVQSVGLMLGLFCLMFPTTLVSSIYRGYQEMYKAYGWDVVASIFSLGALLFISHRQGGLLLLILAFTGTRIIVRFVNTGYLFLVECPWLLPLPQLTNRSCLLRLWNLGKFYFFQQIGNIGMSQAQPIILAQLLGAIAAGPFFVAYRLMSLLHQLLLLILTPFVSSYSEARSRGDWQWIQHTFVWSIVVSLFLACILAIPMTLFAPFIISIWAGNNMVPDMMTTNWLGLYATMGGVAGPIAVFLAGLEKAREIAAFTTFNGVLVVILGVSLVQAFGMGGMAMAMAIAYALSNVLPQVFIARNILRSKRQIIS